MIKNDFQKILAERKRRKKLNRCFDDKNLIEQTLLKDYNQTIMFLDGSTMEEMSLVMEAIIPFIQKYPRKEVLDLLKRKVIQYKNLKKHCNAPIKETIEQATCIVNKKRQPTVKEQFEYLLQTRKIAKQDSAYPTCAGFDIRDIALTLKKDFNETVSLLKNANKEKIAVAVETLDDLVVFFTKEESKRLIEIFKQKLQEFPDVDDVCEFDYLEQIQEAENILQDK